MKLTNGAYLCPFCLSSFLCEGPHIKEEDDKNFNEFIEYTKIDHVELVLEEILKYQRDNMIDLTELSNSIEIRLMERDK